MGVISGLDAAISYFQWMGDSLSVENTQVKGLIATAHWRLRDLQTLKEQCAWRKYFLITHQKTEVPVTRQLAFPARRPPQLQL
jgi:maltooligosyltrehalose synthase